MAPSKRGSLAQGSEADELDRALRECRAAIPRLVLFGAFVNLLWLTPPIFALQMFDRVLSSGRLETLVALTLMAGIALAFMSLFDTLRAMMLARISYWLDRRLTGNIVSASVRASLAGLPLNTQSLSDLAVLRAVLAGPCVVAVLDLLWAPIFIVVVWFIHPWLALLGLGAVAVSLVVMILAEATSRRPLREANAMVATNLGRAETAIRNADVFQAMGMLPAFLGNWNARNEPALALQMRAGDRNALLHGLSRFVRFLVQVLILALGAYLVIQRQLTPGGMIAASMILYRTLGPVEQAIGAWTQIVTARAAHARLRAVLALVPRAGEAMALPRPRGRLVADAVTYLRPDRREPVLEAIRFQLKPGEVLGVIGPSASGKSTLCRLLVGVIQPARGSIRLDGADLYTWPADKRGPFLGYLPQEIELFEGTVGSNIARLDVNADPEAVVEAARVAGVHEMILRLPEGYDTEIGVAGGRLSGGQRQRIGLARALYGRPSLIVLDEPNASLDGEGEISLIKAINTAKGWGSTVVIVAHQPHIVKPADKLLVLKNGRVDLFGAREEILHSLRAVRTTPGERPTLPRQAPAAGPVSAPAGPAPAGEPDKAAGAPAGPAASSALQVTP